MRYLYAVETAAQLSAYEAIANRLRPRLEAYLRFLREEYAGHPRVRRLVLSPDGGTTDLVLRAFT